MKCDICHKNLHPMYNANICTECTIPLFKKEEWEEVIEDFLINPSYMATIEKGARLPWIKPKQTKYNLELRNKIYELLSRYIITGYIKISAKKGKIVIERIEE